MKLASHFWWGVFLAFVGNWDCCRDAIGFGISISPSSLIYLGDNQQQISAYAYIIVEDLGGFWELIVVVMGLIFSRFVYSGYTASTRLAVTQFWIFSVFCKFIFC